MKKNSRRLRKNQTDAEKKIWYFLRNRRFSGLKFRRQYPIGSFIVDFCCLEKKIIIEVDGSQHFEQVSSDAQRTFFLHQQGFKVLRFWNNEVLNKSEAVLEAILLTLLPPHPDPLPKGEGK